MTPLVHTDRLVIVVHWCEKRGKGRGDWEAVAPPPIISKWV